MPSLTAALIVAQAQYEGLSVRHSESVTALESKLSLTLKEANSAKSALTSSELNLLNTVKRLQLARLALGGGAYAAAAAGAAQLKRCGFRWLRASAGLARLSSRFEKQGKALEVTKAGKFARSPPPLHLPSPSLRPPLALLSASSLFALN